VLQIDVASRTSRGTGQKGATVRAKAEAWFPVKTSSRVYLPAVCAPAVLSSKKANTRKGKHVSAEAGAQSFLALSKTSKPLLSSLCCSLQRLVFVFRNVVYHTLSHKY